MTSLEYQKKIQDNLERHRLDAEKDYQTQKWFERLPAIVFFLFLVVVVVLAINHYNEVKTVKNARMQAEAQTELAKVQCERGIEKYREWVWRMAIRDVKKERVCRLCQTDHTTFADLEAKYDILLHQVFKGSVANILPVNADKIWRESWDKT